MAKNDTGRAALRRSLEPISLLAVAVTGGTVTTLLASGPARGGFDVAILAAFGAALAVLAWADIRTGYIPNRWIYPAIGGALAAAVIRPDHSVGSAMGGLVLGAAPFVLLFMLAPGPDSDAGAEGMPAPVGGGDVKLAALAGAVVGSSGVLAALFIGVGTAWLACGVLLAMRRRAALGVTGIAYGPFLALGAVIALV